MTEQTQERAASKPWVEPANIGPIMFGLVLSLFLANLDQTIVATCLTAIGHDLEHFELLPWVISAYLVTSTATAPIYGRLSDRYGRRITMLTSIGIFVVFSAFCAAAPTMHLLILARAIQGVGGGGLRSISQIVIADIIPPRTRGKYQGYMSTAFLLSTTLGPVLGGLFAQHLTWRWAFWINLPLGGIGFFVIDRQLRRLVLPIRKHKIDWLGAVLILATAVPLMIGLSAVENRGWSDWSVVLPMGVGVVSGVALVLRELQVVEPMLPMRLFRNAVYTIGNIALFLPSMVMTALIILLPLYYQLVRGLTADAAGLRLISLTGGMAVGSYLVGSWTSRLGRAKIFPLTGSIVSTGLLALIAALGLGRWLSFDVACTFVLGLAIGAQINPLNVMIQNGLEVRDIGAGISGMTFFRALAGAFGVAVFMSYLIAALRTGALSTPGHEKLGSDPGAGLLRVGAMRGFTARQAEAFALVREHAFTSAFVLAAIVSGLAVVAVVVLQERPLRTSAGRASHIVVEGD